MKSLLRPLSSALGPLSSALKPSARSLSSVAAKSFSAPRNPLDKDRSVGKLVKPKPIPTQDMSDLIRGNQLGVGSTPQNILPGKKNFFAGKLVTFQEPWKPQTVDPEANISIVLSCGLGGCGSSDSLYESFYPLSQLIDNGNVAVYSSLTDGERNPERFRKGLPYYYDESHINQEESENFFNKILRKKFFDQNDKLKDPKNITNLMLFGFSIGHRENVSHVNFLSEKISKALEKENKSPELLQEYFNKIALINIGSPVNWSDRKLPKEMLSELEKGSLSLKEAEEYCQKNATRIDDPSGERPIVRTVNYRSVLDMGTAKPMADFNNFHCNKKLFIPRIFEFSRPERDFDVMYLIGSELVRDEFRESYHLEDGFKSNMFGHNFGSYLDAIYGHVETMFPIGRLLLSKEWAGMSEIEQDGTVKMPYDQNRKPSESDKGVLKSKWEISIFEQTARKFYTQSVQARDSQSR